MGKWARMELTLLNPASLKCPIKDYDCSFLLHVELGATGVRVRKDNGDSIKLH